jgi:hypothetical protein
MNNQSLFCIIDKILFSSECDLMVNATGFVTFLTYKLDPKFYINRDHNLIKISSFKTVNDVDGNPAFEVTCKYSVYLPVHYECKSLEDYTGKVYPFLVNFLKRNIIRTEVHLLTYKLPPQRNKSYKRKRTRKKS